MVRFVKIFPQLLDNPIVCKDADHLAVWIYLLLNANSFPKEEMFNNERIIVKPGQMIRGRKMISSKIMVQESKVERILKLFKNEQQIEQVSSSKNRLITVLNWSSYQKNEQRNGQQVNNERTTSEQQVNTNKNNKKDKKDKNKDSFKDIVEKSIEYLNIQTGHNFKPTEANTRHLMARINEGYTLKQIMTVIRNKTVEWEEDEKMKKFLRPETLFGTKFDSYLNYDPGGRTTAEVMEMINENSMHLENMTGPWECHILDSSKLPTSEIERENEIK